MDISFRNIKESKTNISELMLLKNRNEKNSKQKFNKKDFVSEKYMNELKSYNVIVPFRKEN